MLEMVRVVHYFGGAEVVTLARIGNLKVQIYADNHLPPHLHIVAPDFEALVNLGDFAIMHGRQHARQIAPALSWVRDNAALLAAEWDRLNER